jgi:precorrin-4 C11-methyltransferase/precorrin-2 C(20)-methyltransferase
MSRILYGIGVGPGDPELLTLKAVRLIAEADVVFCPQVAGGEPGRAHRAASRHLAGVRVVELSMEMRSGREQSLAEAAATVLAELGQGRGVYLTEGDPSLYSTFQLLADALRAADSSLEIAVVPGVSAITAAAAAARVPLAMGEETLAILPASAPTPLIEDALQTLDHTVLLKPSIAGAELGQLLEALDVLDSSTLVIEASNQEQEVLSGRAARKAPPPYFSTWLVSGQPPRREQGRVHFIGAGPGSSSLLTRRGLALLRRADLVVAADSLVAPEVIDLARPGAEVVGTSRLTLEEVVPHMIEGARAGKVVVRLHSGDASVYGAISEQIALLREAECPYEIVPGVSSAFAAAAALGVELTEAGGAQTVVFTRHSRQVPTPASERLQELARHRGTLCIFLSAPLAGEVQAELLEAGLAPDTPAAIAYRVSWPDEIVVRTTIAGIETEIKRLGLKRHTLILVGEALVAGRRRSRLYDSAHSHIHRPRGKESLPSLPSAPALVALTQPGARLARRLGRTMGLVRLVVPESLAEPGEETLGLASKKVAELFAQKVPLVLFMAVGAATRLLAPHLRDKEAEPPVVVVDDAGCFAVSLLGGRAAGANRLAEWVAGVLGAQAVITTAAERLGLPALDQVLGALGWRVAEGQRLASLEAAIVDGAPVGFYGPGLDPPAGFKWTPIQDLSHPDRPLRGLVASDRVIHPPEGWALCRPRRLRLGLGCATGALGEEACRVALAGLAQAGLVPEGVGQVATIDRRGRHEAVRAASSLLGAEIVLFSSEELSQVAVPNGSEAVQRAVGTPSVAEAAALLASGEGPLLLPKLARGQVTVAIAEVQT